MFSCRFSFSGSCGASSCAFAGVLRSLAFDDGAYAQAQQATAAAASRFYDRSLSLGAVLERIRSALFPSS
jgi:hypothetical protein